MSNEISTRGFAAGYISPLILLVVCAGILINDSSLLGYRLCIFLAGMWWFVFTIPFILFVHPRPGDPLPQHTSMLTFGWKRIFKTFKNARKLPNTFRYLISYLIFSDGYNTVGSVGVLFGTEELGLEGTGLVVLAIIVPLAALIGNIFFLWIQRTYGWTSKRILQFHLLFLLMLPIYGLFGFFAPFGLVSLGELYAFGFVYGFNLGSIQSFSRTLFADLIPIGYEAEFFGLYEITDKGSSWIGPLLVSVILQGTGSMRWALFVLVVFFLVPYFLLSKVDVESGRMEAREFGNQVGEASDGSEPTDVLTTSMKEFSVDS
eukprot:TRINITY_DN1416_c0_g1_i4.p1 TRINITY_DN1416_c0_g1~~TRINITY_DN1416_c0_g1_i4.p1  ORF type:complete len:318 (-),score=58.44 TRINITY_DN1416_c0_g1_i4:179-1132(-)